MRGPVDSNGEAGWLYPSWPKAAVALLVAAVAFFLPQRVPLEWYPLNDPGPDLNYLQISCAANINGEVRILYDLGGLGNSPIDAISWPISSSTQTFTYTFPLPDAPIVELRVLPPKGGELTIRQMRIINRGGEELRRFTRDLFRIQQDVAAIEPLPDGWKIIAAPGGANPSTRIELYASIDPVGKNRRNLARCLLSTAYLTLMLGILLLAILFAFSRPKTARDIAKHLAFLSALSTFFAIVGNRGLIRNSIHYASFTPVTFPPDLKLEFDVSGSERHSAQLFLDTGAGFLEERSSRVSYEQHAGLQTLRFPLPGDRALKAIRFDPFDGQGRLKIRGIRVVDAGQNTKAVLPLEALQPIRDVEELEIASDSLNLITFPAARDPITELSPSAVETVNQTLFGEQEIFRLARMR